MDVTVQASEVGSGRITLTPNAVSTITFLANVQRVQVWTDGTSPVYVTTDGQQPSIDGRECYEIPPGALGEYLTPDSAGGDTVRLLSAGAAVVRVERG